MLFIIFILITVIFNIWFIRVLRNGFTTQLKVEKKNQQVFIDRAVFHAGVFYKTVASKKLNRKDFETIVLDTYNWLPIRAGGSGYKDLPGFWESVLAAYDIPYEYDSDGNFEPGEFHGKKLASAMWLSLEEDFQKNKLELYMTEEKRQEKSKKDREAFSI